MSTSETPKANASLADEYAVRLKTHASPLWKRLLDVQAPYRWNLRRLQPGLVLDVGCGLGRNLAHVRGHGVGVDANASCVAEARRAGFEAYTPDAFKTSPHAEGRRFDSLLVAHVLEHLPLADAKALVKEYLPHVRPGGRAIFITPQEAGYRSDETHVSFVDDRILGQLAAELGLVTERCYSFPFPRLVGRFFKYNEFVLVARLPD